MSKRAWYTRCPVLCIWFVAGLALVVPLGVSACGRAAQKVRPSSPEPSLSAAEQDFLSRFRASSDQVQRANYPLRGYIFAAKGNVVCRSPVAVRQALRKMHITWTSIRHAVHEIGSQWNAWRGKPAPSTRFGSAHRLWLRYLAMENTVALTLAEVIRNQRQETWSLNRWLSSRRSSWGARGLDNDGLQIASRLLDEAYDLLDKVLDEMPSPLPKPD